MSESSISQKSLQNLSQYNKEHRRLTREALETALLALLESKELASISISELVKRAGVSRNAYYRNYKSKEAIFESILEGSVKRIFAGLKPFNLKTQTYQAWLYLFSEAKQEGQLLAILFRQNSEKLLIAIVAKRLRAYQKLTGKQLSQYIISFWSNAIISVLEKWVAEDMSVSEEELAGIGLPLLP